MFTGIIQAVGQLKKLQASDLGLALSIATPDNYCSNLKIGDSIAVNGVCLTATKVQPGSFSAFVSSETLHVTTMQYLALGAEVNLEKSLTLSDFIGGHLVTGHVDAIAEITNVEDVGAARLIEVTVPSAYKRFVAKKGAITVAGISLTVNKVDDDRVELMLIPHTLKQTTLHALKVGDKINIEVDLIARYCERLLGEKAL